MGRLRSTSVSLQNNRGIIFISCTFVVMIFLILASVLLTRHVGERRMEETDRSSIQALYLAEAGMHLAIRQLRDGTNADWSAWDGDGNSYSITLSSSDSGGLTTGDFTVSITDIAGGAPTVEASGFVPSINAPQARRTIRAGSSSAHPIYIHAAFGGNSSGDPNYIMEFGGTGWRGDDINGDIYANGDISVTGSASVSGDAQATGTVTGTAGTSGVEPLEPPDLIGMHYEEIAGVKVAEEFADPDNLVSKRNVGPESSWGWGGDETPHMNSWVTTVEESNPAHIFATNVLNDYGPIDDATGSTTNDNYFLGDWHAASDGERITVGANGNNQAYYVDGNVWIETNGRGPRFDNSPAGGTRITIVAKGNIYVADQITYENSRRDGLAMIAMKDGETFTDKGNGQYDDHELYQDLNANNQWDDGEPYTDTPDWQFTPGVDSFEDLNENGQYDGNSENSGNIYFGDPNVGPVGEIDSFLYAENNFNDYNVNANNEAQDFTINGNLTAGNQLRINRDYVRRVRVRRWRGEDEWRTEISHAQMTVNYDVRMEDGLLRLPTLPRGQTDPGESILLGLSGWHEVD